MLRKYRGLQTHGFGIKGKPVSYKPFQLVLSFREAPEETRCSDVSSVPPLLSPNACSMLLVISAVPVYSVYKSM